MRLQPARPRYVAAIIERADDHILIALPSATEATRQWQFPRGLGTRNESAEASMRRVALDQLGLYVELVVGQPPLLVEIEGHPAELRYFFCGIAGGCEKPGPYAEIRWVPKAHLREYDFDAPSQPVVEWLLQA